MDKLGTNMLSIFSEVVPSSEVEMYGQVGRNSLSIVGRLSTLQSVHYRRFHCTYLLLISLCSISPPQFEMSYSDDFYSYLFDNALSGEEVYYSKSLRTVDLTLTSGDSVPYGAVCTAYGKYRLDHGSITEDTNIPPVSCGTVASPWPGRYLTQDFTVFHQVLIHVKSEKHMSMNNVIKARANPASVSC